MIQRVLMKPFLDHLNCNKDKPEWVTKQQWAVSSKGQTDNYWFPHIICLISLSEQADSPYSPSRLICPNTSLWPLSTPPQTCTRTDTNTHTHTNKCRHTETETHAYILTSGQKFFGNFSFSTVVTLSREPTCLFCPDTALKSLTVRDREGGERVKEWENMQTPINKLVLTSSEPHMWWEDL